MKSKYLKEISEIVQSLKKSLNTILGRSEKNDPKIFVIGRNKTGTTSLQVTFQRLGFMVGDQSEAEKLAPYYHDGNFKPIIDYCHSAQVFQDVPFSWPGTYKNLYNAFPNAKFILSIRNTSEEWYDSMIRFQTHRFGRVPTLEDIKNSDYVWKGWTYENHLAFYGADEPRPWPKDKEIVRYENHNKEVIEFFRNRPGQLLVINLAEKNSYKEFCAFLNIVDTTFRDFPWENKSTG